MHNALVIRVKWRKLQRVSAVIAYMAAIRRLDEMSSKVKWEVETIGGN